MIVELLLFSGVILLIAYGFYRQRRPDLVILQLEESQIPEQLDELLEEKQPIVVRGIAPPKGMTLDSFQKIERLGKFPVGGHSLSTVLSQPAMLASAAGAPALSEEAQEQLAEELALPVWAAHSWLPRLRSATTFGWAAGTLQARAVLGGLGLQRTRAITTAIFPTDGKYIVSILSRESEAFLPPKWQYRYPSTFSVNDTPLVSDLKYLDIVLRPGTGLLLPAHTVFSMAPAEDSSPFQAAAILEYHEPVSLLVKTLS